MVRVINPYATERPIGQMIAQIGQQLFGDQAGAQLAREQAYAASRANAETDNLTRWAATGQNLNNLSPEAAAMLIGSGYDPNDLGRIGSLYASTNLGPRAPETTGWLTGLGEYRNTPEAFDLDLAEVARNNDLQSADRRYNVDQNVAENRRQFDMTPQEALVNGQPAFVPRSGAFDTGVAPVLSETDVLGTELQRMFPTLTPEQQRTAVGAAPSFDQVRAGVAADALGTEAGLAGLDPNTQTFVGAGAAAPGTSWNYIMPDGQVIITNDRAFAAGTDAQGNPLPPGGRRGELTGGAEALGLPTNAVRTDLQTDVVATQKFRSLAGLMQDLVDDPTMVWGPQAWLTNRVQEVAQLVGDVVSYVRPEDAAVVQQYLPDIYNPNLPRAQVLYSLLLYSAAAALAGQENRSVSDRDIQVMRGLVPNPEGLFTSRARMAEALATVNDILGGYEAVTQNALQGGFAVGGAAPVAPAAAPAPNLTPNPDGTFTWTP